MGSNTPPMCMAGRLAIEVPLQKQAYFQPEEHIDGEVSLVLYVSHR